MNNEKQYETSFDGFEYLQRSVSHSLMCVGKSEIKINVYVGFK